MSNDDRWSAKDTFWLLIVCVAGYVIYSKWSDPPPQPPARSEEYTYRVANYNTFACKDMADLQRIWPVWGDRERFSFAMRRCILFNKGEKLIVERRDESSGFYLARRTDDPQGYWFTEASVEKTNRID